jgi:AcrR family transcriptional regulator
MLSIETETKLDPRVRRTRQMLEKAFNDLIEEKGFQAISVQDITERAGVNRATFYAHFEDKFDLLDYSIRQSFRQEIDKRTLNACHFSPDNLRNLVVAVCEFVKNTHSHCSPPQGQFEALVETQVKNQIYELLLKWLQQMESDIAPESVATAASWAMYGLAHQWSHSKRAQSAEQFADEVLPLVAGNLRIKEMV